MESFEIGSSTDVLLRFHSRLFDDERWIESYDVTLLSQGIEATVHVENPRYGHPPSAFFQQLARSWQAWKPENDWRAMEAELYLSATADKLGHITLVAELRGDFYQPWRASGEAILEAGQLDSVAFRAGRFFSADL